MKSRSHETYAGAFSFAVPLCAIVLAAVLSYALYSTRTAHSTGTFASEKATLPPPPSSSESASPGDSAPQKTVEPVELVLVAGGEGWLLSIATPLANRLEHEHRRPLFLALPDSRTDEAATFLRRLPPGRCLVLGSSPQPSLTEDIEGLTADVVLTGAQPVQAGLQLAKRFWGTSDAVVVASLADPGAMILGSTLATHLAVPFIPVDTQRDGDALRKGLTELQTKHVLVATADTSGRLSWPETLADTAQFLNPPAIHRVMVERIGAKNIRNIILTRVPSETPSVGGTAWLAPYLSLVRRSPVVLCNSPDGKEAETKVLALLAAHSLSPRSVTILADYDSIGVITVKDPEVLGEYEVDIEPCSGPFKGGGSPLGVGRIHFVSLEEASLLITRTVAKESLFGEAPARVLMVANPETANGALPFCETVSRATAEEFKNFGMKIDEFYGKPPNDPAMLEDASKADLILYEGHITDQQLFEDPFFSSQPEEGYPPSDSEDERQEESPFPEGGANLDRDSGQNGQTYSFNSGHEIVEMEAADLYHEIPGLKAFQSEEFAPGEPTHIPSQKRGPPLDRLPVLVFQSCHSLEEWLAQGAFQSGGIGVVGSVTNVYSASGSAFVKTFCDGLLYHGDTVGEALRDARNYFICLARLKAQRGHKEQAKVYRAALSFRLWGDPETVIPHCPDEAPKLPPVSATLVAPDKIIISTPARHLVECYTEKYFVRMFPGSQLAGVVKRIKDRPARRLMPFYFFRLPIPEGFTLREYVGVHHPGDTSPRAAFLADPFCRFFYVLYFPEKEKARDSLILQFYKSAPPLGGALRYEGTEDNETSKASSMDHGCVPPAGGNLRYGAPENQAERLPGTGRYCLALDI